MVNCMAKRSARKILTVHWARCGGKKWCDLMEIDLSESKFDGLEGIHIAWFNDRRGPRALYIGHGDIAKHFAAHRADAKFTRYQAFGILVTWAWVAAEDRGGVVRYLADQMNPILGCGSVANDTVSVNRPW